MRCRSLALVAALGGLLAAGCEDGPKQVFSPNTGDPAAQNGLDHPTPYTPPGTKGFETDQTSRDDTGRGRFCTVEENEALIADLFDEPILPNDSIGKVPLWTVDNRPMPADELLKDGKFCDPDIYSNAFAWGPLYELVFLFDQETRLVDYVVARTQYRGKLEGTFTGTHEDGTAGQIPVSVQLRKRALIDGKELDQFAARGEENDKPRAWVNPKNVTNIYKMVRETFFHDEPFAPDYDCVASGLCNVVYSGDNVTIVLLSDSGLALVFSLDGQVTEADIFPVRSAKFEQATTVALGADPDTYAPSFDSTSRSECKLSLPDALTYADFHTRCIGADEKTLQRAGFSTHTQRDGSDVAFNGSTFTFKRDITTQPVFGNAERPVDSDSLVGFQISRGLTAPLAEFKPRTLALAFKARLEQRMHEAVHQAAVGGGDPDAAVPAPDAAPVAVDAGVAVPDGGVIAPPPATPDAGGGAGGPVHPFLAYELVVPPDLLTDAADQPAPIDQLKYHARGSDRDWITDIVADIRNRYTALTPEEKAQVDPEVIEATWIVEAYTDALLDQFSHGHTTDENALKRYLNPDDKRFSVGYANFTIGDVPYRLETDFSINYGALTAVTTSKGRTFIDDIFYKLNDRLRPAPTFGHKSPFYGLDLAKKDPADNPLSLGAAGIKVYSANLQLNTLEVDVARPVGDRDAVDFLRMTATGLPKEQNNGFLRQIRGQRWEFKPADVVYLLGQETELVFWVEPDGRIGKIKEYDFKQPVEICPGLPIRFGDDIRKKVEEFTATQGLAARQSCDIVFNYSTNGNILNEVSSLANLVSFGTTNGRATSASVWR